MKSLCLLVLPLLILTTTPARPARPARGQCCLGAQDRSTDSKGGRFRVVAESLNGKNHHGPFEYRFTLSERLESGEYKKLDSFEEKWDDKCHFTMKVMVSPLGNGFAVEFPSGCLTFYRRDGHATYKLNTNRVLTSNANLPFQKVSREELEEESAFWKANHREFRETESGLNVAICEIVWFGSGGYEIEEASIFLPLGIETNRLSDMQAIWYLFSWPDKTRRREADAREALARLQVATEPERKQATQEVLKFGSTAIPVIERVIDRTSDLASRDQLKSLLKDLEPWRVAVGEAGWRDLDLIDSMLFYPDSIVQNEARRQLTRLIEPNFDGKSSEELHIWFVEHRDRLEWKPSTMKYVAKALNE